LFYISIRVIGFKINILNIFKVFWKKYVLALHLVEVDTDSVPGPDRQALDAKMMPIRLDPDLDPQHWI
jgi:hypothetical protein